MGRLLVLRDTMKRSMPFQIHVWVQEDQPRDMGFGIELHKGDLLLEFAVDALSSYLVYRYSMGAFRQIGLILGKELGSWLITVNMMRLPEELTLDPGARQKWERMK